ncbi:hypothetical protein ACLOJK_033817 [Asimina triloba]
MSVSAISDQPAMSVSAIFDQPAMSIIITGYLRTRARDRPIFVHAISFVDGWARRARANSNAMGQLCTARTYLPLPADLCELGMAEREMLADPPNSLLPLATQPRETSTSPPSLRRVTVSQRSPSLLVCLHSGVLPLSLSLSAPASSLSPCVSPLRLAPSLPVSLRSGLVPLSLSLSAPAFSLSPCLSPLRPRSSLPVSLRSGLLPLSLSLSTLAPVCFTLSLVSPNFAAIFKGARNWSRLNNAVMVFDKSHPLLYHFIQEFTQTFDGNRGSLFDILRRMGRLDISTAVAYALDIARGMNYLHQHKPHVIVHRDLTPRNVLQDEAGRLKAQAERLVGEIHVNELELEKLNTVRRHLENGNVETNAARNRFGRSSSMLGFANYIVETPDRPYAGGRSENQQKLLLSNFEESDRDNSSKHGEV